MKQGRMFLPLCAALVALLAAPLPAAAAAKKSGAATTETAKAKRTTRRFTGVVTAMDRASLTVEKGGKKPKTMVFTKHAEMKTTGDVEKSARVTVHYREEGGQPIAIRVVAKTGAATASK